MDDTKKQEGAGAVELAPWEQELLDEAQSDAPPAPRCPLWAGGDDPLQWGQCVHPPMGEGHPTGAGPDGDALHRNRAGVLWNTPTGVLRVTGPNPEVLSPTARGAELPEGWKLREERGERIAYHPKLHAVGVEEDATDQGEMASWSDPENGWLPLLGADGERRGWWQPRAWYPGCPPSPEHVEFTLPDGSRGTRMLGQFIPSGVRVTRVPMGDYVMTAAGVAHGDDRYDASDGDRERTIPVGPADLILWGQAGRSDEDLTRFWIQPASRPAVGPGLIPLALLQGVERTGGRDGVGRGITAFVLHPHLCGYVDDWLGVDETSPSAYPQTRDYHGFEGVQSSVALDLLTGWLRRPAELRARRRHADARRRRRAGR